MTNTLSRPTSTGDATTLTRRQFRQNASAASACACRKATANAQGESCMRGCETDGPETGT